MERITSRKHLLAISLVVAATMLSTTCDNPVDLLEEVKVEAMKANDRYLEVVSYSPAFNSTDVNPGLPIQILLDRAINVDDILPENILVQYTNASLQVIDTAWTVLFESATNVLSLRPEPYLEDSEDYLVTISGLMGTDGSGMLDDISWSFSTGIAPKGSLIVESTDASSQPGYTRTTTVEASVDTYSAADQWFASTTPITTVDASLDWRALTYVFPLTMTSPPQGTNKIYAVFRNSLGGKYGVETYKTIYYDSIAPSAPSTPDLAATDDTGYLNTDNITKNTTGLTFSGTGESNTTINVRTSGTVYGTTTVTKFGTWSVDISLTASGTPYSLYSQATDRAGNIGTASTTVSVTVDTTAPASPSVADLAAADDTGMSSSDNMTQATSGLTFSGTGSILSTRIYLNNGSSDLAYITAAGTSWNMDLSLAQGTHSIRAVNEDTAGNRSASGYITVIVDTTAPTIATFTAGSGNPLSTNSPNVTLYISASDSGSGIYQSHYGNYGQAWSSWEAYSITKAWSLQDIAGTRRVYIQITDYAGNITGQIYDEIILNARLTITLSQIYLTNDGDVDVLIDNNGEIYYYFYVDGTLRLVRSEASYLSINSPYTIAAQLPPATFTIYEDPVSGAYTLTGTVYDDDSPSSDDYGILAAITYSAPFYDVASTYRTFGLVNTGEDVEGRLYYSVDFENP